MTNELDENKKIRVEKVLVLMIERNHALLSSQNPGHKDSAVIA